jgi:recombination protein RecA
MTCRLTRLIRGVPLRILTCERRRKSEMPGARAHLESLLRERKLDVTLTSGAPCARVARDGAPTGIAQIDDALGGGLVRGHLSEIVGPRSSGRTSVLCHVFAAAAERGEAVALIDTCDRFDPASAESAGVDLTKLLWVRDTGNADRALKAMNLVLQAGGFGIVAFDLADVHAVAVRQFPYTTWMRIARVIEGSQTVALIAGAERIARSPGGVTIALDAPADGPRGRWSGTANRARLLRGLDVQPRIVGMR